MWSNPVSIPDFRCAQCLSASRVVWRPGLERRDARSGNKMHNPCYPARAVWILFASGPHQKNRSSQLHASQLLIIVIRKDFSTHWEVQTLPSLLVAHNRTDTRSWTACERTGESGCFAATPNFIATANFIVFSRPLSNQETDKDSGNQSEKECAPRETPVLNSVSIGSRGAGAWCRGVIVFVLPILGLIRGRRGI